MDKIAVLIPCYNESLTVAKVVKDWKKALPEAVIYVYDNNSKDDTAKIARNAGAIVRNEYQQGKGNVIRRMFREIDAEVYVMVEVMIHIRQIVRKKWLIWFCISRLIW